MTSAIFYPKQHTELLRKANLLGSGFVEIKAIHRYKKQEVSEDGITFKEESRPEVDDLMTTSTSCILNQSGQIAGNWTNGLTSEEKRIINEECGVPLFYLNEPINQVTGKQQNLDTIIHVREGQIFDLTNPRDVAMMRVLFEVVSTIGKDKKEAIDNGASFYFHSKEEEKKEKEIETKKRKGAARLIDELSGKEKRQIVRIMILDGNYPADPFITEAMASEIFDEVAFTMPADVLDAHVKEQKDKYICAMSLIRNGHIESGSISDGPYFKNQTIYGKKTHIADSHSELILKIDSHHDLMKAYREMENIVLGENYVEVSNMARETASISFLKQHNITKEVSEANPFITEVSNDQKTEADKNISSVKFMNITQVVEALDKEGVDHDFDSSSNLKEAKETLVNYLKRK